MPRNCVQLSLLLVIKVASLVAIPKHDGQLGCVLGMHPPLVHVQPAKVAAVLLEPLAALVDEVLVTEDQDAPLGGPQRELILLLVGELAELQAPDLGADVGSHVFALGDGGQEGLLGRVGEGGAVDMLIGGQGTL